jgi:hypothetical protein
VEFLPLRLPEDYSLATILDLEQWTWQCIEAIPNDMLQHVMTSLPRQVQECGREDEGYLKSVVF